MKLCVRRCGGGETGEARADVAMSSGERGVGAAWGSTVCKRKMFAWTGMVGGGGKGMLGASKSQEPACLVVDGV